MINQHQTLQVGGSYQDADGDCFGGQLDCKVLANLLKIVVLSQTVVFLRQLGFPLINHIKLCRWVCHIKTQVGIGVNWTVKSLPTC